MPGIRQRKQRSLLTKVTNRQNTQVSKQGDGEAANVRGSNYQGVLKAVNLMLGLVAMVFCGYKHASFMATLHENYLWFSNIKEVEREISFRTESGLYYSYYKQMVNAPTLSQGLYELTHDNLTEHPSTINVLSRMNIYQEVILAVIYKHLLPSWLSVEPVYFYINTVFALHAVLVSSLFTLTWLLSGSWISGILASCFYIFNRLDATRVEFVIPLRESFSLPFLWLQTTGISCFLRYRISRMAERLYSCGIFLSTLAFALCWQFSQFILLLQAFSLFGVWVLNMVSRQKVTTLFIIQAGSLLIVCLLQAANKMILGSLSLSFILACLLIMPVQVRVRSGVTVQLLKTVLFSCSALLLMAVFNYTIKFVISLEADEHIFRFILTKFGLGFTRDFDARLYLCNGAFGFLTFDTYERLSKGIVFPIYAVVHIGLLILLAMTCFHNWRFSSGPQTAKGLNSRPELAFHTVQAVLFGILAMSTLRMKYLWTPYMCVLASVGLGDYAMWRTLFKRFSDSWLALQICRHAVTLLVLMSLLLATLPGVYRELEDLKEFWDPDTVDLMEWIKKETPQNASFSGSMQLLAGVKLCTGRPVTNHPHYEDRGLREKTKQIYQMYGRKLPADVHKILKRYNSNYIILEDSICLSPSKAGCRLPDLIDIDNGEVPDGGKEELGLKYNKNPRFCNEIRFNRNEYTKYFNYWAPHADS